MNIDIRDAIAELESVRISLPNAQELPDDALIDAYERELGVSFSDEYKVLPRRRAIVSLVVRMRFD